MDDIIRIERVIFCCPETNSKDYNCYPMIEREHFNVMEAEYEADKSKTYVYGFVRKENNKDPFIDLYVWDCLQYPEHFMRFVIREGYRLSETDLDMFLHYTKDKDLHSNMDNELQMYLKMFDYYPQWHLKLRCERLIGEDLERIYYMSHRSGCREILYKAGLNQIADNISKIPGYNIIGSTPVEIIGHDVSLRLLRILNEPRFIYKLYSEETIDECVFVYKMFASYIGRELPSFIQWEYLTELYRHDGILWGIKFDRKIYRQLYNAQSRRSLLLYERFFELRQILADMYKGHIPTLYNLELDIASMENILRFKSNERILNPQVKSRKLHQKEYEFYSDKYTVTMPKDCMDIFKESMIQSNCLLEYIYEHAAGTTTILFVRRISEPEKSYVTMEIKANGKISQVFGRFNNLPDKSVYEFIEEYALKRGYIYDPEELIGKTVDDCNTTEELQEYMEDYKKRNNGYLMYKTKGKNEMVQLTLKECFPEIAAV